MPWRTRLCCGAILLSVLVFLPISQDAWCAETRLSPLVNLKQEYNDNLFFSDDKAKGEFITTVGAGLHFLRRTDRDNLDFEGRADQLFYKRYTDFNEPEYFLDGAFSHEATPRLNFFTQATYKRQISTDRDFEQTGIVERPETSKRQFYSIGGDCELTDLTTATLSYSYGRNDYDDPLDYDSRIHSVSLAFSRLLMQTVSGRLNLGYVRYDLTNSPLINGIVFDTDSAVDNYTLSLGTYYLVSEKLSILCDIGARYTEADTKEETRFDFIPLPPIKESSDESDTEWIANLAINYKGETTNASLTGFRDVSSGGGKYGVTERTSFMFRITRRFAYELSGDLALGYYLNERGSGGTTTGTSLNQEIEEETFTVSPSLRYRFTNELSLLGRWEYTKEEDDERDIDRDRNLWIVQLTYEFPLID